MIARGREIRLRYLIALLLLWSPNRSEAAPVCESLFQASGAVASPNKLLRAVSQPKTLSLRDEYEYLLWRHRAGYNPSKIKGDLPRIVELAETILKGHSVEFERSKVDVENHLDLPILLIKPSAQSSSSLNQLAAQLNMSNFGLKIVYNPFTLLQYSGDAYFSPTENTIGIPHSMVISGTPDLSFQHELIHANHYANRIKGRDSVFYGVMRLLEGRTLIRENSEVYQKMMTLEEVHTVSHAAVEHVKSLREQIDRINESNEQERFEAIRRDDFKKQFMEYFSVLRTGALVSLQARTIMDHAIDSLKRNSSTLEVSPEAISPAGSSKSRSILNAKLKFTFSESVGSSAGRQGEANQGEQKTVELDIPIVTDADAEIFKTQGQDALRNRLLMRLESLRLKSELIRESFETVKNSIPVNVADVIEFEEIDLKKLNLANDRLMRVLSVEIDSVK
jgi:hypothetical protein